MENPDIVNAMMCIQQVIEECLKDIQGDLLCLFDPETNDWINPSEEDKSNIENEKIKEQIARFLKVSRCDPFKPNDLDVLMDLDRERFFIEGHLSIDFHLRNISDYIEYYYPVAEQMMLMSRILSTYFYLNKMFQKYLDETRTIISE